MAVETELIVLHYTKTGDRSVVVHTLSRDYGRKSFLFKNVGSGSIFSMFQPLSIIECSVRENSLSSLFTAGKPVAVSPLSGIRGNLYKNSISMFLGEVLFRVIKDGTDEPGLFDWCKKSILLLDAMESDYSNFHIRFLLELAVVMGFAPSSEGLAPFAGEDKAVADIFLKESFGNSMLVPMSGNMRSRLAASLLKYIEFHSEISLNVNSLKVLHELLGE